MSLFRGYKFRIEPTQHQIKQFEKIFATVRFTYNELLKEWIQDPRIDLQCELVRLISKYPWLAFIDFSILQHTVRNLEHSCFRCQQTYGSIVSSCQLPGRNRKNDEPTERMQNPDFQGKKCRPRFKSSSDLHASFTCSVRQNVCISKNRLIFGNTNYQKSIRMIQSRPLPYGARISSITILKNPSGKYYASLLCRLYQETEPFYSGQKAVGLDYSLPSFFVASDKTLIPDKAFLHHAKQNQEKLTQASQCLSRMVYRSKNYEKQRIKVASIYEKALNQRRDYLHKLSTSIVRQYDIVCVETLNLTEIAQKNPGFAKSVYDNSWGEFVTMLDYKLKERGKKLIKVDRYYPSSKLCHECSYVYRNLQLSDREWDCPVCGTHNDRDYNASLNIRDEGLRILQSQKENHSSYLSTAGFRYSSYQNSQNEESAEQYKPASFHDDEGFYPFEDMIGGKAFNFETSWDTPLYITSEIDEKVNL